MSKLYDPRDRPLAGPSAGHATGPRSRAADTDRARQGRGRVWLGLLGLLAAATACAPDSSSSECVLDEDCRVRGESCDADTNTCVPREHDFSSTAEDPPASSFEGKPIPFFRGRVCTAAGLQVRAGDPIPLTFQPCIHPCIEPGSHVFQHGWGCQGSACSARSVFWVSGEGTSCPAEAWGTFDPGLCDYGRVSISSSLGPITIGDDPVRTALDYEVPYLTNEDLETIAAYSALGESAKAAEASAACRSECDGRSPYGNCLQNCFNAGIAAQYPAQANRRFTIFLDPGNPAPAADCAEPDADCECVEIGF